MNKSDKSDLEILKEARTLLDAHYVKWTSDDGLGGHCAIGCFNLAASGCATVSYGHVNNTWGAVNRSAKRLHPELVGQVRKRFLFGNVDIFDEQPAIFVNNQLDKAAILAVFDDAIGNEELRLLCEAEARKLSEGHHDAMAAVATSAVASIGEAV